MVLRSVSEKGRQLILLWCRFRQNYRIFVISDLDLTQTEEESIGKLTEFVLDQIDWKKGLDAWNRIFVSDQTK